MSLILSTTDEARWMPLFEDSGALLSPLSLSRIHGGHLIFSLRFREPMRETLAYPFPWNLKVSASLETALDVGLLDRPGLDLTRLTLEA